MKVQARLPPHWQFPIQVTAPLLHLYKHGRNSRQRDHARLRRSGTRVKKNIALGSGLSLHPHSPHNMHLISLFIFHEALQGSFISCANPQLDPLKT
jgi:hypothetical protein